MMFDEKKLVYKLDKILKKEFGTNLCFREFAAGYGIADLVFAKNFSFSKRRLKRKPLTDFNSLNIFLTLNNRRTYTLAEILNIFSDLNILNIKRQIRVLVDSGYLEEIEKNVYKKIINQTNFNPIRKIVAIEVKLNDHKNGLIQARRYKYFADESYLAILKEAEKNINIEEFNRQNIGLILFDDKTNSIEVRHPQKNNLFESKINIYAKELMLQKFFKLSF